MPLHFELCPGRMIGGSNPCFIIAEIGQNHQGDIEIAKKMIKMAKDCGADCAKFQKSELEHKFNKRALERIYNSPNSWGKTYGEHKRYLEFSHEQYRELQKYAEEVGIFFTASGMDEMAVDFLHELNVPFFKVASCDANNFPYLEKTAKKGNCTFPTHSYAELDDIVDKVYNLKRHKKGQQGNRCGNCTFPTHSYAELDDIVDKVHNLKRHKKGQQGNRCGRPMVVSSGMQSMETMRRAYKIVKQHNQNFTILQCTSTYPLDPEHVNLKVIGEYQKEFPDIPIGYSGHERGIYITVAAVAMGAKVVERHVTLDKTWKGNDHEASLEPSELAELVRAIRLVERAFGAPTKSMLPCEKICHDKLGKSVVAKVAIPKGSVLCQDMFAVKVGEPKGVAPEDMQELVGKVVKVDVKEDDSITADMIE